MPIPALKSRWPLWLFVVLAGSTIVVALAWLRDAKPVDIAAPTPIETVTEPSEERFRAGAEMGDADAQFNLALMYDLGKAVEADPSEAARWYRLAADQGHVRAQRNLAYLYDVGRGVPQDDQLAAEWNRKAADQGDAGAQNNLATMYYLGRGVEKEYEAAAYWFRKAAVQGDPGAQFNLGRMYEDGKGIPSDPFLAYYWCQIASNNLDNAANRKRAMACGERSAESLDTERRNEALALAEAWTPGLPEPVSR